MCKVGSATLKPLPFLGENSPNFPIGENPNWDSKQQEKRKKKEDTTTNNYTTTNSL